LFYLPREVFLPDTHLFFSGFGNYKKGNKCTDTHQYERYSKQNIVCDHTASLFFFGFFAGFFYQIHENAADTYDQSNDNHIHIYSGRDTGLSNNHVTSSRSDNANMTQIKDPAMLMMLTNIFASGEINAEPIPPSMNPLAMSKKKFASPFVCSEFSAICIEFTVAQGKKTVNNLYPKFISRAFAHHDSCIMCSSLSKSKFRGVEGVGENHSFYVSENEGGNFFRRRKGKKNCCIVYLLNCCGCFPFSVWGIERCPDVS
jgi:hypothetical protein